VICFSNFQITFQIQHFAVLFSVLSFAEWFFKRQANFDSASIILAETDFTIILQTIPNLFADKIRIVNTIFLPKKNFWINFYIKYIMPTTVHPSVISFHLYLIFFRFIYGESSSSDTRFSTRILERSSNSWIFEYGASDGPGSPWLFILQKNHNH